MIKKDSIRQGGVLSGMMYALLMDETNKELIKQKLIDKARYEDQEGQLLENLKNTVNIKAQMKQELDGKAKGK